MTNKYWHTYKINTFEYMYVHVVDLLWGKTEQK